MSKEAKEVCYCQICLKDYNKSAYSENVPKKVSPLVHFWIQFIINFKLYIKMSFEGSEYE